MVPLTSLHRRPFRLVALGAISASVAVACGSSSGGVGDGGHDGSRERDAATDQGVRRDGGHDAGAPDAEAGADDADTSAPDVGTADAGPDAATDAAGDHADVSADVHDSSWIYLEGATATTFCFTTVDGGPYCFGTESFPAPQLAGLKADCTGPSMGTVVASCPTTALVGCCSLTPGTETVVSCYYAGSAGDAASLEATCVGEFGTWSTTPP